MTIFTTVDGNTPLSAEEQADLIPSLGSREELNEFERLNILEAYYWAFNPRRLIRKDPLTESYVRELHRHMFDETWKWAGKYRNTGKTIGVDPSEIRDSLAKLLGDVRYWIDHAIDEPDEIAIRFHNRLVFIHPFPNGNGRHGRLIADVLAKRQGKDIFTWGGLDLGKPGDSRHRYIEAQKTADKGDIQTLLVFARS